MSDEISLPKSCAFFNNKGGVGKTTALANLGHLLGEDTSVVVVDLDPQCNLTQHYLPDSDWERIFAKVDSSASKTIWSCLAPIHKRTSQIAGSRVPIVENDRFNFALVAGHPFISRMDDSLAGEWTETKLGKPGAVGVTLWCRSLVEGIQDAVPGVEYVLFDLGPSLGPLNRSVILSADTFLAPVSPDLFSLYSFANLEAWFKALKKEMNLAKSVLESDEDDNSGEWWYPRMQRGLSIKFLGYISQEYLTRSSRGERRSIRSFESYRRQMPASAKDVLQVLSGETEPIYTTVSAEPSIGVMPHMYSMVSSSHSAHAPIASLKSGDGITGSQFKQRDNYTEDMKKLVAEWKLRMDQVIA